MAALVCAIGRLQADASERRLRFEGSVSCWSRPRPDRLAGSDGV